MTWSTWFQPSESRPLKLTSSNLPEQPSEVTLHDKKTYNGSVPTVSRYAQIMIYDRSARSLVLVNSHGHVRELVKTCG